MTKRRTLARKAHAEGVALHAGIPSRITFHPDEQARGGGIVFVRAGGAQDISASWEHVAPDERLNTCLTRNGQTIKLVEHVMAALAGAGIDDCFVEVDGPEPPILDGAALAYLDIIDKAGVREYGGTRRVCVVRRVVEVGEGDSVARLSPAKAREFHFEIDFPETGKQVIDWVFTPETFRSEIAPARTFGRIEDREKYAAAGYGRGADLTNTLVFQGGKLMNAEAQRFPDEFVRHKVLDAVGDLALAGMPVVGRFEGYRSSHRLNHALLRALFASSGNCEIVAV
jgi:UDP-3-O-[3-hydroxymyristoyl] N-acetylglucosamine deacetylase